MAILIMLLHTVCASPFSSARFQDAVDACIAGDSILLLGDAIYAAVKNGKFAALISSRMDIAWYVIDEDCEIRGVAIDAMHAAASRIGYDTFVELVIAADSTVAW